MVRSAAQFHEESETLTEKLHRKRLEMPFGFRNLKLLLKVHTGNGTCTLRKSRFRLPLHLRTIFVKRDLLKGFLIPLYQKTTLEFLHMLSWMSGFCLQLSNEHSGER